MAFRLVWFREVSRGGGAGQAREVNCLSSFPPLCQERNQRGCVRKRPAAGMILAAVDEKVF